ncbi:hypothetical protein CLM62_18550, partial [Streptomyces sp. SA15]
MSNSQYQTFETYGPSDPYGADPAHEPPVYDPPTDPHSDVHSDAHSAQTPAYGTYTAPAPYEDTYRPAYEAPESPGSELPRQSTPDAPHVPDAPVV